MKALHEQSNGCKLRFEQSGNSEVQLITVVVSPAASAAGRFAVRRDGRLLVSSSSTPFFSAARVLLHEGHDPATRLIMRHERSNTIALVASLGSAAKLTVDENNGTVFAPWKPFLRSAGSPAIAPKASGPSRTAGTATKPMGDAMAETSAMLSSGAIETTTIATPVPIIAAPVITEGEPKLETTTIAMSDTAETMIGSATIPTNLRKVEPKVVVTTFPKQDAEGGGHGR